MRCRGVGTTVQPGASNDFGFLAKVQFSNQVDDSTSSVLADIPGIDHLSLCRATCQNDCIAAFAQEPDECYPACSVPLFVGELRRQMHDHEGLAASGC